MKTATMHQAKTNLSKYVAAVKRGENVTLGYRGNPEVLLTRIPKAPSAAKGKRKLGVGKGKIWVSPDAFSKKVDEEIAREMYGEA